MSNNTTSIADYQKSFAAMLAGAEANADALAGTEDVRNGLAEAAASVQSALNRQSSLQGQAQQATRDLENALDVGKRMYSRLRSGVYMHFGQDSEKLKEFGLQPRRLGKKKPTQPSPNPTETAAAETDGTN